MRPISSNEPTRYEIAAWHNDGRRYLVCYSAGSVSRRTLFSVIQSRAVPLLAKLELGDDARIGPVSMKPRPHCQLIGTDWQVGFTGRTQRDVRDRTAGYSIGTDALEYIGNPPAAAPAAAAAVNAQR
jgi:hypothetical protein